MKRVLMLTACAMILVQPALARVDGTVPSSGEDAAGPVAQAHEAPVLLAKKGSDDGPGHDADDDHGGDRDDDDSDDRSGSGSGGSGSDDDSNDDDSGSGRSKPRLPGGSGCDDAGDIAEHSGCRV